MKTKEELIDRYESLYRKAVASKDVKRMKALGDSERWAFSEMARVHPDIAEAWLSQLEGGMEWDNYLSEREAMNIGKRITNQDGSKGFHWNRETFNKAVESLGGKLEEKPSYNGLALLVTANMIYSDHAKSIAVDDSLFITGSANMDIRSFELNFETCAFLYDRRAVSKSLALMSPLS